jgi:hypothetical protein
LKGITLSKEYLRKDVAQEERTETYEWTSNIDRNLNELSDNVKIITLHSNGKLFWKIYPAMEHSVEI